MGGQRKPYIGQRQSYKDKNSNKSNAQVKISKNEMKMRPQGVT